MTDAEKLNWLDRLVMHHVQETGHFQSYLKRGLAQFEAEWKQEVRNRNFELRMKGEMP